MTMSTENQIKVLLLDRDLITGQIMVENSKERGWSASKINQLQSLIREYDAELKALGYVSDRPKHMMEL